MPKVSVGKRIPAFTAQATGDKAISAKDLPGRKAVVLRVSRDSLGSHEKFQAKHKFPFDLISDPDEKLCRLFDVIKKENMYGRKVMGIERSTFLIDANGVLRREWRKIKVKDHVAEVLEAVKAL